MKIICLRAIDTFSFCKISNGQRFIFDWLVIKLPYYYCFSFLVYSAHPRSTLLACKDTEVVHDKNEAMRDIGLVYLRISVKNDVFETSDPH
jgi:hypothetical protein